MFAHSILESIKWTAVAEKLGKEKDKLFKLGSLSKRLKLFLKGHFYSYPAKYSFTRSSYDFFFIKLVWTMKYIMKNYSCMNTDISSAQFFCSDLGYPKLTWFFQSYKTDFKIEVRFFLLTRNGLLNWYSSMTKKI